MADPRRDLTGQVLDRRFRIEGLLGSGGMGAVWQVQHVESLQRWALKTIDPAHAANPQATERFLREARTAGALRSRHVTRVIDARMSYVHEGAPMPFLVMELLEGCTLEQLIIARGPLRPGELVWVARQLGRALGLAHQRGIVHRDLKPSNVFIARDEEAEPGTADPIVKLCDFGIAKLLGDAQGLAAEGGLATQTGAMMGTPMYLAPELLHGAGGAVPATDQWSLGLVAFRALTGGEYFARARGVAALVLAIAQEPLVAPSQLALGIELPAGFDGWFFRSCARATSDRFPDVGAQIDALAAALGNPEETAPALALQARPELTDAAAGLQSTEISGAAAAVVSAAPTTVTVAAAGASPSDAAPRLSPRRPPGRGSVARTAYVAIACGWAVASLWWIHGRIQQRTDVAVGDGAREALSHLAASPAAPPAAVPSPPPEEPAAPSPARGAQKTEPIAAAGEIPAAPPAPTVAPPAPARAAAARDRRPARPRLRRATEPDDVPAGASRHRLPPGQPCERSAECASGLCAAETCQ